MQRPIEVLSHSPLVCQGVSSYGDSAYYTHAGGAGVFNAGTMRWVEAIFGDQPRGISGATPAFVRQVTANVLRAFADGPAAAASPPATTTWTRCTNTLATASAPAATCPDGRDHNEPSRIRAGFTGSGDA